MMRIRRVATFIMKGMKKLFYPPRTVLETLVYRTLLLRRYQSRGIEDLITIRSEDHRPDTLVSSSPGAMMSRLKQYSDEDLETIRRVMQDLGKRCTVIRNAGTVMTRTFPILGFANLDIREAGNAPDWSSDFSGGSWPSCYHKLLWYRISRKSFNNSWYRGKTDIKIVWELNKHTHFVDLGQAFLLSGDEQYAGEFLKQILSWIKENPVGMGISWTSTLVAAQRVISWIIALNLFQRSTSIAKDDLIRIITQIYWHGRFIERNLEVSERNSNHIISNLAALFVISMVFPEFRDADRWRQKAIKHIYIEVQRQVYPDGVDYEQSSGYHRFVLEFFLLVLYSARQKNFSLEKSFCDRVEEMLVFSQWLTKPDGRVPILGDNDSARVFNLNTSYENDHRTCLALGACMFQRGDFKKTAGQNFENILYLYGKQGYDAYRKIKPCEPEERSRAFWDGGYFIMRDDFSRNSSYLLFDCGYTGMGVAGERLFSHGHSDGLSLVLDIGDEPFIIDPGMYSYTGDKKSHDWFRATRSHNTLMVSGEDQGGLISFWGVERAPHFLGRDWFSSVSCDYVEGTHDGYSRLKKGIVHRRRIYYNRTGLKYWLVVDDVNNLEGKKVEIRFHFHPDISLSLLQDAPGCIAESRRGKKLKVLSYATGELQAGIEDAWYAPVYGKKVRTSAVRFWQDRCPEGRAVTVLIPLGNGVKGAHGPVVRTIATAGRLLGHYLIDGAKKDVVLYESLCTEDMAEDIRVGYRGEFLSLATENGRLVRFFAQNGISLNFNNTTLFQGNEQRHLNRTYS